MLQSGLILIQSGLVGVGYHAKLNKLVSSAQIKLITLRKQCKRLRKTFRTHGAKPPVAKGDWPWGADAVLAELVGLRDVLECATAGK